MKKRTLALLLCAAMIAAGCGSGASLTKVAAEVQGTDTSEAKEEVNAEDIDPLADLIEEAGEETGEGGEASRADDEKKAAADTEAEKTAVEEKAGIEEKAVKKKASKKKKAAAETDDAAEAASGAKSGKDKKTDAGKKAEGKTEAEKKAEELRKAAQEKAKAAAEKKKKFDEEVAGDYVPDGFAPYGVYNLTFDSGYLVKSRYSPAGLTYYMESEEFLFKLNKDLPDMTTNVAHLLFNTTAPMTDAGDEEFPFGESYVLTITLDNGGYYEVYRDNLDLHGRIFVRDVWETFRQKYEGTF
ncbi:MAG: hypothetical protein IJH81_09930 [Lachnospiraceae bacterium]|nr:hypothetical protein [Lachnospiraceae bacterium]